MTKKVKYMLTTLVVAILLVACACGIAACVQDNSVTYTVTVQQDADTPVSGVRVQIGKGTNSFSPKNTDSNGKVTFDLVPDNYTVKLSNLPAGYNADNADLTLTAEKRELTVTLDKNFAYVVKLVDESGAPYYAENVYVMMCTLTNNCLPPVTLGTNGIAELPPLDGVYDYHVKVENLPAHYSVANVDADGYYAGKNFSATETEMTITIYNITSVTDLTPMTEAEKTAYAQSNSSYNSDNGQQFESYQVNKELGANKVAYFSITPTVTGQYRLYANNEVSYLTNGNEFVAGNTGNGLYNTIMCDADKTYYFKAVNNTAQAANVKFVMTAPYSSYVAQTGKGAVVDVTVGKANTNAVVAFRATEAGTYSVKVEGEAKAIVTVLTAQPGEIISAPYADSEYSLNPTKQFVAYTSTLSATNYVTVTAKADSYPVTLKVTIGDRKAPNDTTTVVEVKETLTQYAKPQGQELVGVPMDGAATLVYNETDRFYHLGTIDGPVVVVKITKPLDASRFGDGATLAYMEMATQGQAQYQFVTQKADGEDILDYRKFLRGFDEYDLKPGTHGNELVIPTDITTSVYYANFVNADGVYPLTKELETFLKEFYKVGANKTYVDWNITAATGSEWLFPCYYYDEAGEEETPDAIVGEYKFVSCVLDGESIVVGNDKTIYDDDGLPTTVKATENDYKLVVTKNTFAIMEYNVVDEDYSERDGGTWSKDAEGNYTFTIQSWMTIVYNVTIDETNGIIKLQDTESDEEWQFKIEQQVEA